MTAPDGASAAALAQAHSAVFGLLARVFGAAPTPELVTAMKGQPMLESLAACGLVFAEDFTAAADTGLAESLAQEYTRLFAGPGPHIAAYESVYVPGEGEPQPRLWGAAAVAVAGFYREIGLELPEGRLPDQLGVELEAMALLAEAEAGRLDAGDVAGAERLAGLKDRFCQEHLLRWVPAVCQDVQREARSSFYKSMAALAAGLIEATCGEGDGSGDLQEEEALNETT